jgi:Domain of unknown function (DUF4389)
MTYPVHFHVEPPAARRNRLTVAFRPILAFPHMLVVGGPILGLVGWGYRTGVFGLLALLLALFDWCAIVFTHRPIPSVDSIKRQYLRWRADALAYMALLRDEYPPFGEGPYPAALELPDPPEEHAYASVLLRPLLVFPQVVVTALLLVAWLVAAIISWFEIVITGRLAPGLWRFGYECMRYVLRIEAYLLLVHDEYPPFALTDPEERAQLRPA